MDRLTFRRSLDSSEQLDIPSLCVEEKSHLRADSSGSSSLRTNDAEFQEFELQR